MYRGEIWRSKRIAKQVSLSHTDVANKCYASNNATYQHQLIHQSLLKNYFYSGIFASNVLCCRVICFLAHMIIRFSKKMVELGIEEKEHFDAHKAIPYITSITLCAVICLVGIALYDVIYIQSIY